MDRNATTAQFIYEDIKNAYDTKDTNDIKKALSSVKMVLDSNNDPIPEILKELAKYKIRAVWNKVDTNNSYEVKMGLRYKDMAFEVSN